MPLIADLPFNFGRMGKTYALLLHGISIHQGRICFHYSAGLFFLIRKVVSAMPNRSGLYEVPFSFRELSFDDAVALAADTGMISGGGDPLLETVIDMLDELGRPDEYYDCIQVAGTNGKTSTVRFAQAILRGEGCSCALYTSPQLVRYPERMEINGTVVSDDAFSRGVSAAAEAGRRLNARRTATGEDPYSITPFDLLTCAALVVFAEAQVDVAVLEVGLGGRWDATSATDPVAVAITGIGLDHMRILGNTLAEIAGEKAAVIKPGRKVVLGEGTHEPSVEAVMRDRCESCGIYPVVVSHTTFKEPRFLGDTVDFHCKTSRSAYDVSMVKPSYQPQNAACAIMLCEEYLDRALDAGALERSLMECPTPGRFDVLRRDPLALIDACHNPQSCENFVSALDRIDSDVSHRPTLLTAELADKDVAGIIDVLVPAFPRIIVTQTASERAMPASKLSELVKSKLDELGRPLGDFAGAYASVDAALAALDEAHEPFLAAGTITLAGEVARVLRG